MPGMALPPRFSHPEDAREQVARGLGVANRVFGTRPEGMWPSEGSVSPEVIDLLSSCGVRWCATDEGVLAKSDLSPSEPLPPGMRAHHRGYLAGSQGDVCVLFRDRELSDMIGFRYARMAPETAAADLVRRISAAGNDALVTIALDGENPWEHYPESGEDFLEALYTALSAVPGSTVLPRDGVERVFGTVRDVARSARGGRAPASPASTRGAGSTPISASGSAIPKTTPPGLCSAPPGEPWSRPR